MQFGIKWICDELPPINLWNVWRTTMSDGMTEAYRGWPSDYDSMIRPPHSTHYEKLTPEPIAVIEQWELNFNLGNAVKYIARCDYKGQRKADLEKAIYYLQRELGR